MKGPSLDAIRKFKEQQERKKREEDEKKIQTKLSTLEHRAAQGDKKAKSKLKQIEKIKEEFNKPPEVRVKTQSVSQEIKRQAQVPQKAKPVVRDVTDFDELMRIAKQNTNQPKPPAPVILQEEPKKKKRSDVQRPKQSVAINQHRQQQYESQQQPKVQKPKLPPALSKPPPNLSKPQPSSHQKSTHPSMKLPPTQIRSQHKQAPPPPQHHRQEPPSRLQQQARMHQHRMAEQRFHQQPHASSQFRYRYRHEDEEEEEEDDYESDGFVVDEEDDDIQDEVRNTIRSVFRYDRRACDLREQELDRQYRAIGRVSTFEDLEREERRASKLAAAEDARAQKEEEERKRLKKMRLKK